MKRPGPRFGPTGKAAKAAKPIAAVNLGRTRADDLFDLKVEQPVGETLTALAATLA